VGLSVEAQRTLVPIREIDLDIPSAHHVRLSDGLVPWRVWRLSLSHSGEADLDDQQDNQGARCPHVLW
jgi:hypothetical protein